MASPSSARGTEFHGLTFTFCGSAAKVLDSCKLAVGALFRSRLRPTGAGLLKRQLRKPPRCATPPEQRNSHGRQRTYNFAGRGLRLKKEEAEGCAPRPFRPPPKLSGTKIPKPRLPRNVHVSSRSSGQPGLIVLPTCCCRSGNLVPPSGYLTLPLGFGRHCHDRLGRRHPDDCQLVSNGDAGGSRIRRP